MGVFRMLRVLEQPTGAEVNIIANDKADLKIVLRMWTSDLGLCVYWPGLLEFKDPVEFPGTFVEQARRNQKTIKLVCFFVVRVSLWL